MPGRRKDVASDGAVTRRLYAAVGGFARLETYAALAQTDGSGADADDLVSSVTGQVYVAQSPEAFAYDADGNQTLATTRTGRWRVAYDGENRPVRWTREGDGKTVAMSYDHMGRRRAKGGQRFFYDGNKNVSEVAPPFRVKHPYPGFSGWAMTDRPVVRRCGAGSCSLRAFSGTPL